MFPFQDECGAGIVKWNHGFICAVSYKGEGNSSLAVLFRWDSSLHTLHRITSPQIYISRYLK